MVAGSTLEGEEAALLEAWPKLAEADPNLHSADKDLSAGTPNLHPADEDLSAGTPNLHPADEDLSAVTPDLAMVLAPRHPERFGAVAALLDRSGVRWVRRSEWKEQPPDAQNALRPGEILLLDTIGELASVYSLATVAFVGGSLVPAGGHNPLEPAQFGVPIVMGPHYANFRAITEDLLAHEAVRIAAPGDFFEVLIELFSDGERARAMGRRGRKVFDEQAGATGRCVEAIQSILAPPLPATFTPKPVDPAIEQEARRMKESGAETEGVLAFLRARGLDKIDSIKVLRSLYGLGLAQAKEIVDHTDVWRDRLGPDSLLHEKLWQELQEAANDPKSGIKFDGSAFTIRVDDDAKER